MDSSFLKSKPATGPQVSQGQPANSGKSKAVTTSGRGTFKTEIQGDVTPGAKPISPEVIQSITLILNSTADPLYRNTLLLNRSTSFNLYVRQRLLAGKDLRIDDVGMKYLQAAVNDANAVYSSPRASAEQKQQALYLLGISSVYMDRNSEAREKFIELLRVNPNFKRAGWLALFIAEDYFEQADFNQAMAYYRNFFRQMNPHSREVALYKIAWCLINLKFNDHAEGVFVRLIRTAGAKSGLGKDSVRDLAFLVAHRKDPSGVVAYAEETFTEIGTRLEFLEYVRVSFEDQNLVELHSQVIQTMLALEKAPEKRLLLLISDLKVHRKLYAARTHYASFQKLEEFLHKNKLDLGSRQLSPHAQELEAELQMLIKSWVDTYAGRTKTPETLTREEIAVGLKHQFETFVRHLPKSPLRPQIVNLWLDTCVDTKDWPSIDRVADLVLESPAEFPKLLERAALDQLAALNELVKPGTPASGSNSERDLEKIAEKRLLRMKTFVERHRQSDQWLRIARAYAEILGERKQIPEAIVVLEQIFVKDPTPDSFYRLQFAKFQNGQYKDVIAEQRVPRPAAPGSSPLPPDKRVTDLLRESSLALAMESRKKDDLQGYTENIRRFLSLAPDENKAGLARSDYFRYLLEKNEVKRATSEMAALPETLRTLPALAELTAQAWRRNIDSGQFEAAAQLITSVPARGPLTPALRPQWTLGQVLLGRQLTVRELALLPKQEQEYLVAVFALSQPLRVIEFYETEKKAARAQADRDLLELAWRIHSGSWAIERTGRTENLLGRDYPFVRASSTQALKVENRMSRLEYPTAKTPAAKFAKLIEALVVEVQKIRADVNKELSGQQPETKLRVLEKARDIERKIAEAILNSPIPKEVGAGQLEQYRGALKEAAQEYVSHGEQYEKLANTLRERVSDEKRKELSRIIPAPSAGKWRWPGIASDPPLSSLKTMLAQGNTAGALVLIDLVREARAKSGHNLDDADYFALRAGALLSGRPPHPTEADRIYVLNELESRGMNSIILEWRKMTGLLEKPEAKPEASPEVKPENEGSPSP